MQYEISGVTYASQAAVRERASRCLSKLGPLVGDDERFVRGLLERHPFAADVEGAGVRRIVVKTVMPYGTRGFYVERVDGTGTDFSYLKCLRPTDPRRNFNAACRSAVVSQVQAVRSAAFMQSTTIACPITGVPITRETSHVDHAAPWTFQAIVEQSITDCKVDVSAVTYVGYSSTCHLDGNVEREFTDTLLRRMFADYHAARASLRVVSKHANLSVLRRQAAAHQ